MAKQTFNAAHRDGQKIPTEYTPIHFIAGDRPRKLALHKGWSTGWFVSDPQSGALVCRVRSVYKGVPCSSAGLPLRVAKQFALADLDDLVSRIGAEKFNATLDNPKPF